MSCLCPDRININVIDYRNGKDGGFSLYQTNHQSLWGQNGQPKQPHYHLRIWLQLPVLDQALTVYHDGLASQLLTLELILGLGTGCSPGDLWPYLKTFLVVTTGAEVHWHLEYRISKVLKRWTLALEEQLSRWHWAEKSQAAQWQSLAIPKVLKISLLNLTRKLKHRKIYQRDWEANV